MKHYTPGQKIEARDSATGTWRPAVIERDAPYYFRAGETGGAYVLWTDVQKNPDDPSYMPSAGGWQAENTIREAQARD